MKVDSGANGIWPSAKVCFRRHSSSGTGNLGYRLAVATMFQRLRSAIAVLGLIPFRRRTPIFPHDALTMDDFCA